jgi:gluconokinase
LSAVSRTEPRAKGKVILVMGVSGSGKTAVGQRLARALGAEFIEADDYHAPANVARMRSGTPLHDADRWPWLRRVHDAVRAALTASGGTHPVVLACSALKASYRAVLLAGFDAVAVVMLEVDHATLEERMRYRPGHFMPASLLDSQIQDLEPPANAISVDSTGSVGATVEAIQAALRVR